MHTYSCRLFDRRTFKCIQQEARLDQITDTEYSATASIVRHTATDIEDSGTVSIVRHTAIDTEDSATVSMIPRHTAIDIEDSVTVSMLLHGYRH